MENNEKKEIEFCQGIEQIKQIKDTFFYLKINVDEFNEWANKHKKENGCVYINIAKSRQSELWYGKLSTYTGKTLNKMESEKENYPF